MVRRVSLAYQAQQAVVSQLQGAQGIAIDQAQLYTYRLNLLGKQFGGTQRAQELLVASGVTMNQMLTKTPGALLQIEQQVAGTNNAMRAMGQTSGTLGNDLVLMDKQATPAAAAMQKLNQAWDTFTSQMTGTQNAFDNVALGLRTLNSNATTASHSLGSAHLTIGALGTAMDGLTKNDLALNQAFEAQVSNTNALIDTWRTAGISSNVFTRGVKDAISTLVPFARGSKEATAQLVGLAQEAGFDGPVSMKALVKWLGNTHGALQAVKQITNQATIQEALLTSSMNAQGNLIASKLIGDINSAILAYNGVQKAAANYGKQVAEFGPQSTQAVNALKVLNDHIIASGVAAGDSTRQIAAMIAKVDKIPLSRAIKIVETGLGHFSISGVMASHALANAKLGPGQRPGGGLAAGGLVSHGTGPTSDDAPLLASRGEFVVKSAAVAKYGTHMMNLLNAGRFAAGGSVGSNPQLTGDVNVLTGAAPVNFDRMFVSQFTSSMERAMTASMRAAMAAATAAAARASVPGGATHGSLPYLERLWIAAGGPAGFAHLMAAIAMAESGGNANARNPSGASGLWQILGLPFPGNPFDPMTNARMAVSKFRSQGLGAWVTYTNGAYRQFFGGGGIIDEPIHGVGRSGRQYVFGERGPETVVPGKAAGRTGPLFTINGDLNIKDETDMAMVAQRLSFAVTAASLGS
jgi:hypothetical protein